MKRIYIAGPMTGLSELNFPAFHAAAVALRAQGHHVENPAEINPDPKAQWIDCMRADIARLVTCDAVYLLPGWERSRGAKVEHGLAVGLGMQVMHAPPSGGRLRKTCIEIDMRVGGKMTIDGWRMHCGAVLHRTPWYGGRRRQFWDDHWTVSDPVTGAAMARGTSMVMAVMCYRHIVQMQGSEWGVFLERNRQSYLRKSKEAGQ